MASIILSFVGSQDPYSNHTKKTGSIVNLVNYLQEQSHEIKRVVLLYTEETAQNAIDTQHWLVSEHNLSEEAVAIFSVSEALSIDPINQSLAVQEVRRTLEIIRQDQAGLDTLEFNASSGTPAMKSSWGILQASGYVPQSRLWQVRNPDQMKPGQQLVFRDDLNVLKNEFDLQVIKQQVQDYNYSGALITLNASQINSPVVKAMLEYGYYRISMDFNSAFSSLDGVPVVIAAEWVQEIAPLRQGDKQVLLQEAYFNALIRLQNRRYADFLVGLFKLQEQVLYFLVQQKLGLTVSGNPALKSQSWEVIRQVEGGNLYRFLQGYRLPGGDLLDLNRISRYTLQAIVEYYPQYSTLLPLIQELNQYCELRNESVHGFVGVSEIADETRLLATLSKLMKRVAGIPDVHSFDRLNQHICDLLDRTLQVTEAPIVAVIADL